MSLFVADTKRANGQAFGPDGRLYAVGGTSHEVVAYDPAGKAEVIADHPAHGWRVELLTLASHTDLIWAMAYSPDGETLASGSWDKSIQVWPVKNVNPGE